MLYDVGIVIYNTNLKTVYKKCVYLHVTHDKVIYFNSIIYFEWTYLLNFSDIFFFQLSPRTSQNLSLNYISIDYI